MNFANQELCTAGGIEAKLKASDMEKQALSAVVELVEIAGAFKLEDILKHRVTEESLAIFNVNGTMRKCQKSKLIKSLTLNNISQPNDYTALVDMGLIWQLATPTTENKEKADGSLYTWEDYADKVFKLILERHPNAKRLILINDTYKAPYSIKDSERLIRSGSKPVKNEFMKPKKNVSTATEFHHLLSKPDEKVRLQKFLETEFEKRTYEFNIEIIYTVVGEYSKNLLTHQPEPEMLCLHAEADTALFTIYNTLRISGYTKPIVLDTEDTDNYVQAVYVSNRCPGAMLIKRKNIYVNAQSLVKEVEVYTIIPLHILTGSDHTSG